MIKAENRVLGLKYTIQDLDWVIKDHKKQNKTKQFNKKGKKNIGNMGYHEKKFFRL